MSEINLPNDIPIINTTDEDWKEQLDFELHSLDGSSDYRNDRERPYNGQAHTDDGERGQTPIFGLTMRDLRDCYVKGFLLSVLPEQSELRKKVYDGTWRTMDIYKIDLSGIDPLAVAQNMGCEVEKMMGIYPNVGVLDEEEEIL